MIAVLNATTSLIRERFPSTLVLPVFGNHDYEPDDWLPDNTSLIYQATFELWKPWIGEQAKVCAGDSVPVRDDMPCASVGDADPFCRVRGTRSRHVTKNCRFPYRFMPL